MRALRVTYVGELGWELYCPDRVRRGAVGGARPATRRGSPGGYRAIESLRLEKGYRAWGADIGPETTPAEAGLGFAVRRGRAASSGRACRAAGAARGGCGA